jgi:hypothetical protein
LVPETEDEKQEAIQFDRAFQRGVMTVLSRLPCLGTSALPSNLRFTADKHDCLGRDLGLPSNGLAGFCTTRVLTFGGHFLIENRYVKASDAMAGDNKSTQTRFWCTASLKNQKGDEVCFSACVWLIISATAEEKEQAYYMPHRSSSCFDLRWVPGSHLKIENFNLETLTHLAPRVVHWVQHDYNDDASDEEMFRWYDFSPLANSTCFKQLDLDRPSELMVGQEVIVDGLQHHQSLNGRRGTLSHFSEGRWDVLLETVLELKACRAFKRIRPANLMAVIDMEPCGVDAVHIKSVMRPTPEPLHDVAPQADMQFSQVFESVPHMEPAAHIDEHEAREFVAQQEACFVERNLQHDEHGLCDVDPDDALFVCKLNRNPKVLRKALCGGRALQSCRAALEEAGYNWKLDSGTLVFVHPWQYLAAIHSLRNWHTQPDNIVFAKSVEHLVDETIAESVAGGWGAWAKHCLPLSIANESEAATAGNSEQASLDQGSQAASVEEGRALSMALPEEGFVVSRTFLCEAPGRRPPEAVTQSTTEADSQKRKGTNPRRALSPQSSL